MTLKTAGDFLTELVNAVQPPRGCAISLTERAPTEENESNWRTATDILPLAALSRYDTAVAELRKKFPVVDWTGVTELAGDKRRVAAWLSEVA